MSAEMNQKIVPIDQNNEREVVYYEDHSDWMFSDESGNLYAVFETNNNDLMEYVYALDARIMALFHK